MNKKINQRELAKMASLIAKMLYQRGVPYRKALALARGWMEQVEALTGRK